MPCVVICIFCKIRIMRTRLFIPSGQFSFKKIGLRYFLGILIFASIVLNTVQGREVPWQELPFSVDAKVKSAITEEGVSDFFILLQGTGDYSQADSITDVKNRRKYIFTQLSEVARKSQEDLAAFLESQNFSFRQFYIQNMILVRQGSAGLIEDLVMFSEVTALTPNDPVVLPRLDPRRFSKLESTRSPEWFLSHVHIPDIWTEGVDGSGIVVANLDTGVDWDHPALKAQYRGWNGVNVDHDYNWHAAGSNSDCPDPSVPCDEDRHGTFTMGMMVGFDGGNNRIGGAPGARWIACGHLESAASVHECFEWLLAPYRFGESPWQGLPEKAPDIVNNSWGMPAYGGDPQYLPDVDALQAAGIFMVFAAGNEGDDCETLRSPGDYPQVMTVGACDVENRIVSRSWNGFWGSSRGPAREGIPGAGEFIKPDIVAPGLNIRSSVPGMGYEDGWGGTSMAAPLVSAVTALLWSAAPSLRGDVPATRDLLISTAYSEPMGAGYHSQICAGIDSSSSRPNHVWGWGLLDAQHAYQQINGIFFQRQYYRLSDTIDITVRDNQQPENASVMIRSMLEPEGEHLQLRPAGPGKFTGQIICAPGIPSPQNGILTVIDGETIIGEYASLNASASAGIDGVPPLILNVNLEKISNSHAVICWETDEPVYSTVKYGAGPLDLETRSTLADLHHRITLKNLNECTNYYFDILCEDLAGNQTVDDNGGVHYLFTTYEQVEVFKELMSADPGWEITGEWAWGIPGGLGGDPAGGASGRYVYGYNLNGKYPSNMAMETLSLPPLDCSGTVEVWLDFYRWLGVETASWDHAAIWVSTAEGLGQRVWENGPTMQDTGWKHIRLDLSGICAGESMVNIRWSMGPTDSSVEYSGWNIDDLRIIYVAPCEGPTRTPTGTPTDPPTATPEWTIIPTVTTTPPGTPTEIPTVSPTKLPTETPTPTAISSPTAEPTQTPSETNLPSATPTATPAGPPATATPVCRITGVELTMPSHRFSPDLPCWLKVAICNGRQDIIRDVSLVCVFIWQDSFWFFPDWGTDTAWLNIGDIPPGYDEFWLVKPFTWPSSAGVGQAQFAAALTDSKIWEVVGSISIWDFQWADASDANSDAQ